MGATHRFSAQTLQSFQRRKRRSGHAAGHGVRRRAARWSVVCDARQSGPVQRTCSEGGLQRSGNRVRPPLLRTGGSNHLRVRRIPVAPRRGRRPRRPGRTTLQIEGNRRCRNTLQTANGISYGPARLCSGAVTLRKRKKYELPGPSDIGKLVLVGENRYIDHREASRVVSQLKELPSSVGQSQIIAVANDHRRRYQKEKRRSQQLSGAPAGAFPLLETDSP